MDPLEQNQPKQKSFVGTYNNSKENGVFIFIFLTVAENITELWPVNPQGILLKALDK